MKKYPTPHIAAKPEDFAKTVLMPGDPMRSRFIAKNYLTDAKLINNIRGVQGYTGTYKGTRVSVMASGMGMPSMAIYSHELFNFFEVDNIIRVGSAGAMKSNIELMDLVLVAGASTDSSYAHKFSFLGSFAPIASFNLLRTAADTADEIGIKTHVGNVLSSDVFYEEDFTLEEPSYKKWARMGVLAVEMETAALYMNAAWAGKNALSMLTISDKLTDGTSLTAKEREKSFIEMITLALETARKLGKK